MKRSRNFDFQTVVIGSGVAGRAAALASVQSGQTTAVVEADLWGGTNYTKFHLPRLIALEFARQYSEALRAHPRGLSSSSLRYNYPTALQWRSQAVEHLDLRSPATLQAANIACIEGNARFISPHQLTIGEQIITAQRFVIATGTRLLQPNITGLDQINYLTPADCYVLPRLPRSVLIAGAGAVGCELAQYFATLGVFVVLAEIAPRLLPRADEEVGKLLSNYFNAKLNIKVLEQARVVAVTQDAASKRVVFVQDGIERAVRVDALCLATGTAPVTDLGLENAGVDFTKQGIITNKYLQTTTRHIAAAGTVVNRHLSVEQAESQGRLSLNNLLKRHKTVVNQLGDMRIVHTSPAVAAIGYSEDDCLRADQKFTKVLVPISEITWAKLADLQTGFIKLLLGRQNQLLGASVVAPDAPLLLQELALAYRENISLERLAQMPHPADSPLVLISQALQDLI